MKPIELNEAYRCKLEKLQRMFLAHFGETQPESARHRTWVFASAPGRVELAGNHTDHQGGRVISAAIDLRIYALAALNGTSKVRLAMEGFGEAEFDLATPHVLEPAAHEQGTSLSLVKGMMALRAQRGGHLDGFDLATISDIPAGGGLSSSAAFEMMVGRCLEALFDEANPAASTCPAAPASGIDPEPATPDSAPLASTPDSAPLASAPDSVAGTTNAANPAPLDPVALALEGMAAERVYFGKPCGAQDQIASSCGSTVAMDFASNPPAVRALAFDTATFGHTLCLIDSRCDHSLYTSEFAAIPTDMQAVASLFDAELLGQVDPHSFLENLDAVRASLGDGAALRALHYFDETLRVEEQQHALEACDVEAFLAHVRLSGASSAQYLQNVSPRGDGTGAQQPAMVILALCAHLLGNQGAWRIHGGGFGGSVLALVPEHAIGTFTADMNAALGYEACRALRIDPQGAFALRLER